MQSSNIYVLKCLRNIALGALLLISPLAERAAVAQAPDSLLLRFESYSALRSPEKVYLHYDRSCYTAGETIWFRGWIKEASSLSLLPPSNFIYAELLDERGEAVVRVKIKRTNDAFPGRIELPDHLETGYYTIRAYTRWQLNNQKDYLFNDRIRIVGSNKKKEKSPKSSSSEIAISFWPEGGRYFAGQNSVIGFKVVDKLGKSVDFSGFLVNEEGETLEPVHTLYDGMGSFSFLPQKGKTYSIMDDSGKIYPMPPSSEDGALLQLHIRSGRYYISTLGYGGGVASLLVRDASELRPLSNITLDGKASTFVMDKSFFHPGINHFLIVDSRGQILAERLFFVRDDEAPLCKLDMETFIPAPRALTRAVVSLKKPDGTPLDGNCSVSVVRGALKSWQQSDGIASYMGLSSELKGNINKPYYYFDPDIPEKERDAALDLLMMIQGWRFYDLEKIAGTTGGDFKIKHSRELTQEIRGSVSRKRSSKMPENYSFTFMIPKQKILHYLTVERGKYFIIDSLDFQENTEMLINIGRLPRGKRYYPKWDGDAVADSHIYKPAPGFSVEARLVSPTLSDMASGDTLQAAVIVASYGDKDVLVFGRSYKEDLSTYKDWTLLEYITMTKAAFEYDGENMYNRNKRRGSLLSDDSEENSETEDDETGKVKLIVDDNEEAWWSYDLVRLEDLRTLSISTQADPIYGGDGGVVHITLKPGGVRRDVDRDPSLLYFIPLGHQVPRYFEAPRYDRGEDGGYDNRNTVLWAPEVVIAGGSATIEFCNSDKPDYPYVIRIEGMSADGRPFSRHCLVTPE